MSYIDRLFLECSERAVGFELYEGTDNSKNAIRAYLDWEFGLVDQLKKDAMNGFFCCLDILI